MPTILDLHVHTVAGSSDSSLKIDELVTAAGSAGLDGVCLTEHRGPWDPHDFGRLRREHEELVFVNAMEVESTSGHITVFGLDRFVGGIHDPEVLRSVADAQQAYLVLAHPFRYWLSSPASNLLYRDSPRVPQHPRDAAEHPIFELIDAIEVSNGGTSPAENAFALEVARYLGKPTVGGSDAHSTHGLGRSVTVFDDDITDGDGLIEALHASRFHAGMRAPDGTLLTMG